MATNIPPHNLGEVIDATIHLLEHPEATPDDLMEFVKGPDFPTGGSSSDARGSWTPTGPAGVHQACGPWPRSTRAGTGHSDRGHRDAVPDHPWTRREEDLRAGPHRRLDGIAEAQDDSSGGKTRLVIRLKRDANANVVLNNLFKQTPLQTSFGVNMRGPGRTGCPARSIWSRC